MTAHSRPDRCEAQLVYIVTADTKDASDLEPYRFLYDDQRTGCFGSAEARNHLPPLFSPLCGPSRDRESYVARKQGAEPSRTGLEMSRSTAADSPFTNSKVKILSNLRIAA